MKPLEEKVMSKYILLLLIIVSCFSLTGCWNYNEVNSFYIVSGVAIDKDKELNQYIVTTELINIKENKLGQSYESLKIESKGDSIFEAVRTMIRVSAKKLYWSHTTTLIVSEDIARDSIMPILDWISRDQEPRLRINIFTAIGQPAADVLENESFSTDIRSFELEIMSHENKDLVSMPEIKVYELINELSIPKFHTVLPTVQSTSNLGKNTNLVSGGAILNKDKLIGFLSEEDIVPYLFIRDKINAGLIKIKTGENNPNDTIILEIFDSKTKIKPVYTNETIGFDIHVETEVSIAELTTQTDYISEPGRSELKRLSQETLNSDIKKTIENVQEEYGLDIFGFGNIIRQRNPKLWRKIEKDWDTIFMDISLNVSSEIIIRNSGQITKPIEVVK